MIKIVNEDSLFEMANLSPKRTGLKVTIWSDNDGISRNLKHNYPRVKIGKNKDWVVVSIERNPKILSKSSNIKKSEMDHIKDGIDYVGRNHDIFLKHFMSNNEEFDDQDLMNALRERGEYK